VLQARAAELKGKRFGPPCRVAGIRWERIQGQTCSCTVDLFGPLWQVVVCASPVEQRSRLAVSGAQIKRSVHGWWMKILLV
jgi:hypothetical protein